MITNEPNPLEKLKFSIANSTELLDMFLPLLKKKGKKKK